MKISFTESQPKEKGYYIWRSNSGNFYLAEVREGEGFSGKKDRWLEKGQLYVFGCCPGGAWLTEKFGGTWSEKLEFDEAICQQTKKLDK
jgi:hypothetical protein